MRVKSHFQFVKENVIKSLYFCFWMVGSLGGHENRVTSLAVAENGIALASSSWDQNVRVWVAQ